MANKYGEAAIIAAKSEGNPVERWRHATATIFPQSKSSQIKGCPKGAFLGLCEVGAVSGIKTGNYTTSKDNKRYTLRALALLVEGHSADNALDLWKSVMNETKKAHNSQMDVVLALWNAGFLKR